MSRGSDGDRLVSQIISGTAGTAAVEVRSRDTCSRGTPVATGGDAGGTKRDLSR